MNILRDMTSFSRSTVTGAVQTLRRLFRPGSPVPTEPLSRQFGFDRGQPIDRHYIEAFLAANAAEIRGEVLEVGSPAYTHRYGTSQVTRSLVLNGVGGDAILNMDLSRTADVPEGMADCFICTQTFNFIFDVQAAVHSSFRLLRPGGTLLATVAGITQISGYDRERWGDYWRFTECSMKALLAPVFGDRFEVRVWGNLHAATALLQGQAIEDLERPELLDVADPDYPVVITAVARRAQA
ncbi:MAG: methyltransferase domain-containing protein [Rhodocyclaceae bacterium]|nr:methyltransferase domain-containing protein [Rhodocyclaceae bacterium]